MIATYHILVRVNETLESVLFALVKDLDQVIKELIVVLATMKVVIKRLKCQGWSGMNGMMCEWRFSLGAQVWWTPFLRRCIFFPPGELCPISIFYCD